MCYTKPHGNIDDVNYQTDKFDKFNEFHILKIERYYFHVDYNKLTNSTCRKFNFDGSFLGSNNFETKEQCNKVCSDVMLNSRFSP